ncbi:MAG: hypothetical protein HC844_07535 [Tabrizicola sp.]|nr:hypothetical protein [Tabrizicola sp.]
MPQDHQIVIMADPRFPGGSSRALAAEARALSNAGIAAGFCPMLGPELRQPHGVHPAVQEFLDDGTLTIIDPREVATARVVIAHHPTMFLNLPHEPFGLSPETLILVLHHPLRDGFGVAQYDLARVIANASELLGCRVTLAPVSPVVRSQLQHQVFDADLLPEDWVNLLDFAAWPIRKAPGQRAGEVIIGRHSRPQSSKFPDTREEATLVYPTAPGFRVRMLGFPADLCDRYRPIPGNWELLDFGAEEVSAFLRGLDYYVYFHGDVWVEAFGYAILEAIATGVPVILPPRFAPVFGEAALYSTPEGVQALIARQERHPEARLAHLRKARLLAEERFSVDGFIPRLQRTVPGWTVARKVAARRPPDVVMITSNGVGLGHLTRLMAVAKHLPAPAQISFFTLSQGFRLALEAGYLTQYVPFHRVTGASVAAWNLALAEELGDFLDLTRPEIVVFDGNVPYSGMLAALDARGWIKRVWMRRALWNPLAAQPIKDAERFDLILEPGELAARFDTGATTRSAAIVLPPVVQIDPADRLSREDALAELGLEAGRLNVGVMLGAGTNFDLTGIRQAMLDQLLCHPEVAVTEFVPPIAGGDPARSARHRGVACHPAARLTAAFDFMIAGAGYNSFHEAMLHRVPTIFVPNEADEMDCQSLRARYARSIGCGEMVRASDRIGLGAVIGRMLDPAVRASMTRRMSRFVAADGAKEAARIISLFGNMTRLRQGF